MTLTYTDAFAIQIHEGELIPAARREETRQRAKLGALGELESLLEFREDMDDWKAEGRLMQAYAEQAADMIASANNIVILVGRAGMNDAGFMALSNLAQDQAIPVCEGYYLNLPTTHPMNLGPANQSVFDWADVVIVLDSLVPWMPSSAARAHGRRRSPRRMARTCLPGRSRHPDCPDSGCLPRLRSGRSRRVSPTACTTIRSS